MVKSLMMLILSLFLSQTAFSQASSAPTKSADAENPHSPNNVKTPERYELLIADSLVRVLITKGILTEAEGHTIAAGGSPIEQRDRLASLLRDKGLLTAAEYEAVRTVVPAEGLAKVSSSSPVNVSLGAEASTKPQTPAPAPTVIAAIAPVRLLSTDPPKREGLIPDIKLGTGARLKLYGFFKTSVIHDSSSPQGNRSSFPRLAICQPMSQTSWDLVSDREPILNVRQSKDVLLPSGNSTKLPGWCPRNSSSASSTHAVLQSLQRLVYLQQKDGTRVGLLMSITDMTRPRRVTRGALARVAQEANLFSGNLQYKWNSFVTFGYEQGLYRTRATDRFGALPLFRGIPSYTSHNIRSEFAAIFSI